MLIAAYVVPFVSFHLIFLGRILLFEGPINGMDLETPIKPEYYLWKFEYPWHPLGLGTQILPDLHDVIYGFTAILAGRSVLLAQIVILTLPPLISYVSMLLLTRRQLGHCLGAAIVGSVFYAFSPWYLAWFTLPLTFSYALLPLLFYFELELFSFFSAAEVRLGEFARIFLPFVAVVGAIASLLFFAIPVLIGIILVHSLILGAFCRSRPTGRRAIYYLLAVVISVPLLFLSYPPSYQIFLSLASGEFNQLIQGAAEPAKLFYRDATLTNVIRLAGMEYSLATQQSYNTNLLGFVIPGVAFLGLVFAARNRTRSDSFYLSSLCVSVLLLTLVQVVRTLTEIDSSVLSNPLLVSLRRPERILMVLSVMFALMVSFTFDRISKISLKIPLRKPITNLTARKVGTVFMLLFLVSYMSYTRPYDITLWKGNTFVRTPSEYADLENVLNQISPEAGIPERFLLVPLYVQDASFESFNHPGLFYYSTTLASRETDEFGSSVRQLIVDQDESALSGLGLASVAWVVVVPQSFTQEELQPWRISGNIQQNGVWLWGDPALYRAYLNRTGATLVKTGPVYMASIPNSSPLAYIPSTLLSRERNLTNTLWLMPRLNEISPLGLTAISSEQAPSQDTLTDTEFSTGTQKTVRLIPSVDSLLKRIDLSSLTYRFNDTSFTVWGDNVVSTGSPNVSITGRIPSNSESLSIWVVPSSPIQLANVTYVEFYGKVQDPNEVEISLLDNEYKTIEGSNTRPLPNYSNLTDYLRFEFTTRLESPTAQVIRIVIHGTPNQEVALQANELRIGSHKLVIRSDPQQDGQLYVLLPRQQGVSLKPFVYVQQGSQTELPPFSYASLRSFVISSRISFSPWNVTNQKLDWISPTEASLEATVALREGQVPNQEIEVPLIFNNAYEENWKLQVSFSSGEVSRIEHKIANGFANLWMITLDFAGSSSLAKLHVRFYWDEGDLLLYRVRILMFAVVYLAAVGFAVGSGNPLRRRVSPNPSRPSSASPEFWQQSNSEDSSGSLGDKQRRSNYP